MYCTIFVPLSVVKVLGKHVRISSYLVLAFFKKNLHSNGEIYRTAFSITITSHQAMPPTDFEVYPEVFHWGDSEVFLVS